MIASSSFAQGEVSARRMQSSRRPAKLDLAWTTASTVKASLSSAASASAHCIAAPDASTTPSARAELEASRMPSISKVAKHPYSTFSNYSHSNAVTPPLTSLFTAASLQEQKSRSACPSGQSSKLLLPREKTIRLLKRGSLDMLLLENPNTGPSRRRLSRSISPLGFLSSRSITGASKFTNVPIPSTSSSSPTQVGVILSLESNLDAFRLEEATKPRQCGKNSVSKELHRSVLKSSLASPNARDPSAFEIDQMCLCGSPSVPASLGSGSRWTPPNEWNVFDDDFAPSHLGVLTPKSPEHPEPVTYLQVLLKSPGHSILAASGFKTGKIRITEQSIVSLSPLTSMSSNRAGHMNSQRNSSEAWVLTVTGENQRQNQAQGIASDRGLPLMSVSSWSSEPIDSNVEYLAWSFTSAPLDQLSVWHELIETSISDVKRHGQREDPSGRWSAHLGDDLERFPLPIGVYQSDSFDRSEPSILGLSSQTELCKSLEQEVLRDRMDEKEVSKDEPECLGLQDLRTASTRSSTHSYVYTLEDSYRSIMQRYPDNSLNSPVDCLRTPRGAASDRRLSIDVPMSPHSYDLIDRRYDSDFERPGSPVDPWISIREVDIPIQIKGSSLAEETALDLLSEGFQWDTSSPSADPLEIYTADIGATWRHSEI